jgi:hypothetical protein
VWLVLEVKKSVKGRKKKNYQGYCGIFKKSYTKTKIFPLFISIDKGV